MWKKEDCSVERLNLVHIIVFLPFMLASPFPFSPPQSQFITQHYFQPPRIIFLITLSETHLLTFYVADGDGEMGKRRDNKQQRSRAWFYSCASKAASRWSTLRLKGKSGLWSAHKQICTGVICADVFFYTCVDVNIFFIFHFKPTSRQEVGSISQIWDLLRFGSCVGSSVSLGYP